MLKIENLNYSVFENGREIEILKDISLTFQDKKLYVITGPNGSGKSTLVKLIMGIGSLKQGKIFLDDKDISNYSIDSRAREGISFAFQKPVTFKGIKVGKLLDIASEKNNTISNSCEYLSKVGLCARNYKDRYMDESLSGGELKRIELAMALSRPAKVYIFDEPEAGIDLWSFDKLSSLFSGIKETTIIVSHQKEILKLADEIILLSNGKVEKVGKGSEILPLLENFSCKKLRGENGQDW